MTSNEKPPENSNGAWQASTDKIDYSLAERRLERDQTNEIMEALSEQQVLESKSPELRTIVEGIFRKEKELDKEENEYIYYSEEHESGISVQDAKKHHAIIAHLKEELGNLKEAKRKLIEQLRNEHKKE